MDRDYGRKRRRRVLRRILTVFTAAGVLFFAGAGTAALINRPGLPASQNALSPKNTLRPSSAVFSGPSSAPPSSLPLSSASPPLANLPSSAPPESEPSEEGSAADSASPPESMVEESWFDDAAFIGNSRTEGLANYDGLGGAAYYALKGLMVSTVGTKPAVRIGNEKVSVMQALRRNKFKKVYVMLGINELGWSSFQTFVDDYGTMVDEIKEDQPGAAVYLQSILPVTEKESESSTIYTNRKIDDYNEAIQKIAEQKEVRYLAVGSALSDSSGCLPAGASADGIHLNAEYCGKWCDYLRSHT